MAEENGIAKAELVVAAEELNEKILTKETAIKITGRKATSDQLEKDIKDAAALINPEDQFSEETWKVLREMAIEGLPQIPVNDSPQTSEVVEESMVETEKTELATGKTDNTPEKQADSLQDKPEATGEGQTKGKAGKAVKKAEAKPKGKKKRNKGIGEFVRSGLIDGSFKGMKNAEIAKLAVEKFHGNTKPSCIGWYKNKLQKSNIEINI